MDELREQVAALQQELRQQKQDTEHRLATADVELGKLRHRLQVTWACALVGALGTFVLGANPEARAQVTGGLPALAARLQVVESNVRDLAAGFQTVEFKTQDMIRVTDPNTGQLTVRFIGVNLQIVDGSGDTSGPVNGLGNLIIGYNEVRGGEDVRTGSHNLIVGNLHNYSSFGGLVAGQSNLISGAFCSVSGGLGNRASGGYDSVNGGRHNSATGGFSSVSGGSENVAGGFISSISGGSENVASGFRSSVSGGRFNSATGTFSSVSGGFGNWATGDYSSVSGGYSRSVSGDFSWRAGDLFQAL